MKVGTGFPICFFPAPRLTSLSGKVSQIKHMFPDGLLAIEPEEHLYRAHALQLRPISGHAFPPHGRKRNLKNNKNAICVG